MEQRGLQETVVYQDLQEILDWLVCLDQWDQLGPLVLPDLLDQVIVLDLMTWKDLVEFSPMDFLVSEDQKEYRVLLAYLDSQVNLGCLASQVRRAVKVLQEETGNQAWMASLDLRDQRLKKVTKERGANQVEMELDSQVHQVHQDHQDKSSTIHLTTLTVVLAELGLRVGLVYLVKLDFLVRLDRKVTEETLVLQATQ